jgi:hypothetical protein
VLESSLETPVLEYTRGKCENYLHPLNKDVGGFVELIKTVAASWGTSSAHRLKPRRD